METKAEPTVVMRGKKPPLENSVEADPRQTMDECIQQVRKAGRGSLQMAEGPFEGVRFTHQKSPHLETVLEKLLADYFPHKEDTNVGILL